MATFTVTTLADGFGTGGLSLREALSLAQADPDADIIRFASGLAGGVTPGVDDGHLTLTQGDLIITTNVTIDGDAVGDDNVADITIDANHASRVFHILGQIDVTLDALVIRNGSATGFGFSGGGGIRISDATVTVANSEVSNNTSSQDGGGITNQGGTLALIHSVVSGNHADFGGGGISSYGTVVLTATT